MAYLNPFQSRINDYTYSTGNPMLEPQYGNSLSFGGTFRHKYILRLTLSHSNNGFMEYAEPEEGIIRSTLRNGKRHTALRLYGEVPLKLGKQNNLRFMGSWSYGKEEHDGNVRHHGQWSLRCAGSFRLLGGIGLSTLLWYESSNRGLYTESDNRLLTELSLSKFIPRWRLNIGVSCSDLLNAQGGYTNKAFYPGYTQRSSGNYSTFRASLNLRYLFRWGQKSPRMGSRGNLEENARLGE